MRSSIAFVMTAAIAAGLSHPAGAAEVVRHAIPGSAFPIAAAVEVPAGMTTVYLSGKVPGVVDPDAPRDSLQAYGDTETQTVNVLESIQRQLRSLGLDMKDVVKMQVFLVGGPENDGRMDFAGFMAGYTRFFGEEAGQPALPARSAMQVAGLANPAFRVEIEVVAVRP